MNSISNLIHEYQSGNPNASMEILKRMSPLLKKYASKLHCLEYEDALQEMNLAMLEALNYLKPDWTEEKYLFYLKNVIHHRYCALCKSALSRPQTEDIFLYSATLAAPPTIDDGYYAILAYIDSLPVESTGKKILSMYFLNDNSDTEIAKTLHVSRQYVNRVRRQLIQNYFSKF